MSRPRRALLVLGIVALAAGSFFAGMRFGATRPPGGFAEVAAVAEDIGDRAARPVSEEELVRAAIRGMLDVLDDPYAAYLDPQKAEQARDLLSGSFVGVGMWLEPAKGGLRVTSVLDGSPAADAGIVPGDVVVEAGGRPLADVGIAEAGGLLEGPEGSTVTLVVRTAEGNRQFELERARISLADVQARMLGDVAYVHPLRFGRGTADDLRVELQALVERGAGAIILDLRGNGGGLAEEAVATASLFLSEGVVAHLRSEEGEEELSVEGDPLTRQLPLAVLVDGGTASAAELVAGALQDRGRATVVGTPTFGKGSVLSVEEVGGSGAAIQFTTAFFLTPDGHRIEGRGILPDVPVLPGGPSDAQLDRAVRVVLGEVGP
jgi:carboxyl-terminal processing protease